MAGDELDLDAPEVKVLTLHSAKGLEFPVVVVAGLADGVLPYVSPGSVETDLEEEQQARRLAFVGITRAMHRLLVLYPSRRPSRLVGQLDRQYWDEASLVPARAPIGRPATATVLRP